MSIKTRPFDAAEYLRASEAQAAFLQDAIQTGDDDYIAHARKVIEQAGAIGKQST